MSNIATHYSKDGIAWRRHREKIEAPTNTATQAALAGASGLATATAYGVDGSATTVAPNPLNRSNTNG